MLGLKQLLNKVSFDRDNYCSIKKYYSPSGPALPLAFAARFVRVTPLASLAETHPGSLFAG